MRILDEAAVRAALPWHGLIAALRETFLAGCEMPLRTQHGIAIPGDPDGTLLMMPAWQGGRLIVVKVVNVMPGNGARGLPAVAASVLAFDGRSGAMLAMLDGAEVTARRTAAASALAADALARADAAELLVVGAGRIAANLAQAHCAVRPYARVRIWARRREAADALVRALRGIAPDVAAAEALQAAARTADVISCATLTAAPLIAGAWLKPGAHLDLVGGYTPQMREADDDAVARAGAVYVDTFAGALAEAGDIIQPLASGVLDRARIAGELADLCRRGRAARAGRDGITLFKSVGTALEDFAAAALALGV